MARDCRIDMNASEGSHDIASKPDSGSDPRAMPAQPVDLRSDTVTKPDAGMRQAIAAAEVGDDVYGDDPTTNELERRAAQLLGKEAAAFFPSGTQSNLAAILAHCGRGDEMVVGRTYHTYVSEAGGASALGGVVFCTIPVAEDGSLEPDEINAAVKEDDPHKPRTRLLCLENTVSGTPVPLVRMESAVEAARRRSLSVHLDGARIFNAAAALGTSAADIASAADSVSVCLSKGLGAPAGTVLAGRKGFIGSARRNRKVLGGGMRQTGVLAAAGLYALENNIAKLPDDHRRAEALARALRQIPDSEGLTVRQATNMVFVTPRPEDHAPLLEHLERKSILTGRTRPTLRIVTHLGVTDEDIERAADAFREFYRRAG